MTISRLPSAPAEPKAAYAFGDVIRKYRTRAKYNQRELAKLMGVNQNSICNWETDKRLPDAQTLRRLCMLLDIPLYEFFGMEDRHSGLSEHEQRLLDFYRSLDDNGKEDLETFAEAMSGNVHKRKLRLALERMNSVKDFNELLKARKTVPFSERVGAVKSWADKAIQKISDEQSRKVAFAR